MSTLAYQLVILGPSKDQFQKPLLKELRQQFKQLGLDPASELRVRGSKNWKIDFDGVVVAVWFGGAGTSSDADLALLRRLIEENIAIFPVVADLKTYSASVPPELHPINGQEWDCARIVTDILREFHLTRVQRQVFISYRRTDCLEVAGQLFDRFSRRGYRVFLDTASVDAGVDFQQTLWSRMADVDLLIFLDTPNALTSRWVHEELARAHDLGLGVLQLVWPGHTRTRGTEFSDLLELDLGHFRKKRANATDRFTDDTLDQTCRAAELARIRSLRARRLRVVGDLVDQAKAANLSAVVHPAKAIGILRNKQKVADVIPFVGVPDAFSIQRHEAELPKGSLRRSLILYNGLGVDPAWQKHLAWLNARHPLTTCQIDMVDAWLKKL
jgi:hypothetical protein